MITTTIANLEERIEAACFAALAAEGAAGGPAAADDLLLVAESLGESGRLDEEDLRRRGLASPPHCGEPGILLRAVPVALYTPLDRPRLRREAYRCAALAGPDEGTILTAVATALLTADLLRFDLETALLRVRQSLLEEAPWALLSGLGPLPPGDPLERDDAPLLALQVAITALAGATGIPAVVGALAGRPRLRASVTLAGVLAAARDGLAEAGEAWVAAVPHRARASIIARALAGVAPDGTTIAG